MADKIELTLNSTTLALTKDKYEESYSHVDKWSVSEAGTNIRAVTRLGIPTLSVAYTCDATEYASLMTLNKGSALIASKWDEETGTTSSWTCCMTDLKASLLMETPTTRWYKVSFKLKDLEN